MKVSCVENIVSLMRRYLFHIILMQYLAASLNSNILMFIGFRLSTKSTRKKRRKRKKKKKRIRTGRKTRKRRRRMEVKKRETRKIGNTRTKKKNTKIRKRRKMTG